MNKILRNINTILEKTPLQPLLSPQFRVTVYRMIFFLQTGIVAGILGGFFKLGWEIPFPPRTPDRETPPQILLERIGLNSEEFKYHFSKHTINYGNLIIHFGFSIIVAIVYVIVARYLPLIAKANGTFAGIAVWIIFHLIILPLCKLTPTALDLPWAEQASELFGHIFWMNSIECVRRAALRQASHTD